MRKGENGCFMQKFCSTIARRSPRPLGLLGSAGMAPGTPRMEEAAPAEEEGRDRYVGEKNDKGEFHGKGSLRYANGETYEGTFLHDLQDGHGTHRWPSGASYEGEWIAGVRTGVGSYIFPDGAKFVGRFKANVREGAKGEYVWINGETYTGSFKADKRDGPGLFLWSSGRSDLCTFAKGLPKGEGVRWSADKQRAWRLKDGVQGEEMSLEAADAEKAAFEKAAEAADQKEQAAAAKEAAKRADKAAKEAAKAKKKKR